MLSKPLCLALLVLSFSASAVVIRDDVDDAKYRAPDAELPAAQKGTEGIKLE